MRSRLNRTVGLVCLLTIVGTTVGSVPQATGATTYKAATFVRTLGGPGHAGVYPWGAATALDGSIIITDYWNYTMRRFSPEGELLQTFGGPKGGGPGQNQSPHGVAVDPTDGSIMVSDINNDQVDVFTAAGVFDHSVSTAFPRNYTPRIAVNSQGRFYVPASHVTPDYPHRILVYGENHEFDYEFGTPGSGDGEFGIIRGIDVGPNDELYVLDSGNRRIQVFDAEGEFIRKWGSGGTEPGQFGYDLRGLAIDEVNGWLYVVDAAQSQIEKFELDGDYVTTWGSEGSGPGQFRDGGREITVGLDGRVYAPDFGNHRINVYDPNGGFLFDFPNPPPTPPDGGFNLPQGLAANAAGTQIFVTDTFNHRIQRFTPTGFSAAWGFRGSTDDFAFNYPRGVAIDPTTGDIWVSNSREGNIKVYTPDMSQLIRVFYIDHLANARGIWVGKDGRVYISDARNQTLRVSDKFGKLIYTRPCTGEGGLDGCSGVSQDSNNYIYAASPAENKIFRWTPSGAFLGKWGQAGTVAGRLSGPADVEVYQNRVYVVEGGNNRVSVFTKTGGYLGKFGSKGTGPGQLRDPRSISIDQNGTIYVMDQGNERIVVFRQS